MFSLFLHKTKYNREYIKVKKKVGLNMTKLQLQIVNRAGEQKFAKIESDTKEVPLIAEGAGFVDLAARHFAYEDGDQIRLTVDEAHQYLVVKFDETLDASLVYVPNHEWFYTVTMSDNAIESRADGRFMNERHYLSARLATTEEIQSYRNWALNPHDAKGLHRSVSACSCQCRNP